MPRSPRYLPPGTSHFVTVRCIGAMFLLRPDAELNQIIGFWLARAATRFPGIRLLAAVALSNHVHLLLHDSTSELALFMEYFEGNLAKAVNEVRSRRSLPSTPTREYRFAPGP